MIKREVGAGGGKSRNDLLTYQIFRGYILLRFLSFFQTLDVNGWIILLVSDFVLILTKRVTEQKT